MLNVNRLPNSTRLEIAAAIAEEVYGLELDEEALIHELRRHGFTQAYAEAMTYRYLSPTNLDEAPTERKRQRKPVPVATSQPGWVFVNNVLVRA